MTLTASQVLNLRLNSSAFDAFLQVFDASGNLLAANDNGRGGTNSLVSGTFSAGTFLIEVTAFPGATGAYTVSLTTQ